VSRQIAMRHQYVEYIPERLEPGVLYISKRFRTASHLCCCGCGFKVVTPLNPAKWRLTEHGTSISLSPSIGSWNFPCRSHYFLTRNQIRWLPQFSERQIAAVQKRDQVDVERDSAGKKVATPSVSIFARWFK
jgi:hypothetical protein